MSQNQSSAGADEKMIEEKVFEKENIGFAQAKKKTPVNSKSKNSSKPVPVQTQVWFAS